MTLINRFKGSCGTFGKKNKTHCHQRHWVSLPEILYIYIQNNDHGVDVSMIIIIKLTHIENNELKTIAIKWNS